MVRVGAPVTGGGSSDILGGVSHAKGRLKLCNKLLHHRRGVAGYPPQKGSEESASGIAGGEGFPP